MGRPRKGTLVAAVKDEDPLMKLGAEGGLEAVEFFLQGARRYVLLTSEQEKELGKRILEQGDEKAFETLVNHNLRLPPWIAFKYRRKSKVPVADMIQEGVVGLMIAARKYDYRKGNRFSTYATWWVRQAIVRSVMNDGRMIRIPVHFQEFCMKVLQASTELASDSRGVQPEKIAEYLKSNVKKVREALLCLHTNVASLDEPLNVAFEEEGLTIGDSLVDDVFLNPMQALSAKKELEFVTRWIQLISDTVREEVSERDFRVFQAYYGLNASRERTPAVVVGKKLGLSHSSVSQIIKSVWKKLKRFQNHFDEKMFVLSLEQITVLEDLTSTVVKFQERKEAEFRIHLAAPWYSSAVH